MQIKKSGMVGQNLRMVTLAAGVVLAGCGSSMDYVGDNSKTQSFLEVSPSSTPEPLGTPTANPDSDPIDGGGGDSGNDSGNEGTDPVVEPSSGPSLSPVPSPGPSPVPTLIPGPSPTNSPVVPGAGVCGELYDIRQVTAPISGARPPDRLPDFDSLESVGRVVLKQFNISRRSYRQGIPGVPKSMAEWYGLRFRGELALPESGFYQFGLRSDDGSRLTIDRVAIVHNDGMHSARWISSGRYFLNEGRHDLTLEYFQGPKGSVALQLYWKTPRSNTWKIVPASVLKGYGYDAQKCN